jgi:hypothetical protein
VLRGVFPFFVLIFILRNARLSTSCRVWLLAAECQYRCGMWVLVRDAVRCCAASFFSFDILIFFFFVFVGAVIVAAASTSLAGGRFFGRQRHRWRAWAMAWALPSSSLPPPLPFSFILSS